MAAPLNLELGMSASASSGAEAGRGDVIVESGGRKSTNTTLIVAGLVAIAIAFLVLMRRK